MIGLEQMIETKATFSEKVIQFCKDNNFTLLEGLAEYTQAKGIDCEDVSSLLTNEFKALLKKEAGDLKFPGYYNRKRVMFDDEEILDSKQVLENVRKMVKRFANYGKARPKSRIEPLLKRLQIVWEANPDMRLGQLICNAASDLGKNGDPFYIEDEPLIKSLENPKR